MKIGENGLSSLIRKCPKCGRYSTEVTCFDCKTRTVSAHPPRYSPDDRYGKYRRMSIIMEYGENGKWNNNQI